MKGIIELDKIPENCFECPIVMYSDYDDWCGITLENVDGKSRGKKCPIKIVEDNETKKEYKYIQPKVKEIIRLK